MLLTPDDILKRVLTAIAYSGRSGLPVTRFDETIRKFIPGVSSSFTETAWRWIQRSGDDISVGTVMSDSIPVSDLHGQSVKQLVDKFGDDARFFASEEAQKRALIPSPEARAAIVGFTFEVLCTVAQAGPDGIVATEIARRTGQDPRSLFQRVKTLMNHNLVSKVPVTHNKARTSLITFLGSNDTKVPQIQAHLGSSSVKKVDTKQLRKDIIYTLKNAPDGLRQKFDLRNQLGFHADSTHRKCFNRIIVDLEIRGVVNLLTVKTEIDGRTYKWPCIKLVKAAPQPAQKDNSYGFYDDESEDLSDDSDDSYESGADEQQDEIEEENEEVKLDPEAISALKSSADQMSDGRGSQLVPSTNARPSFSLFLPPDVQIYNFVNSRPTSGVSSMRLTTAIMGWDFYRPSTSFLDKLTIPAFDNKGKSKKNQSFGPFSLMRGQDFKARRNFYRYFTIANYLLVEGMESSEISRMIGDSEFGESLQIRLNRFRGERLKQHLPRFQVCIDFNVLFREESGRTPRPAKDLLSESAVSSPAAASAHPSPSLPPKKKGRPRKYPRPEDETIVPKTEPLDQLPPDAPTTDGEKSSTPARLPEGEASSSKEATNEPIRPIKKRGKAKKARPQEDVQVTLTTPETSPAPTAIDEPPTKIRVDLSSQLTPNEEAPAPPTPEASSVHSAPRRKRGRPRKLSLPQQRNLAPTSDETVTPSNEEPEIPSSKRVKEEPIETTEIETQGSRSKHEAEPSEKITAQEVIELEGENHNHNDDHNASMESMASDQPNAIAQSPRKSPIEALTSASQYIESQNQLPSGSETFLHAEDANETKRKASTPELNNLDEDRKRAKTLSGLDRYRAYKSRYREQTSRPNVSSSPLKDPSALSTLEASPRPPGRPRLLSSTTRAESSAQFTKMLTGGLKFAAQQRQKRIMEILNKHEGLLRAGDELQNIYNSTYKPSHLLDSATMYRDLESLISKGLIHKVAVSVEMSSGNRVVKWIIIDSSIPLDSPRVKEFEKITIDKQKAYNPYATFKPRPVVQGNVNMYSEAGKVRLQEIKKAIEKANEIKAKKEAIRQKKETQRTNARQDLRATMRKAQSENLTKPTTKRKRNLYEFSAREIDTLLRGVIIVCSLSKANFEWAKLKALFKDIPLSKIKAKVRDLKKTDFNSSVQEKYFTRWKRIFLPAYRAGKLTVAEDFDYDIRGFVHYWRDTEASYAKIRDLKNLPDSIDTIRKIYDIVSCPSEDISDRINTFHSYSKEREAMALLSFSKESMLNSDDSIDTPEATEIRSLIYNHDLFSEEIGKFSQTIGEAKRAKLNDTIQKMRRRKVIVRVRDNSAPKSKWDFIDKVHSIFKVKPSANILEDAGEFIMTLLDILHQENKGFIISRAPPSSTAMVLIDFVARGIIQFDRSWPEKEPRPVFCSISESQKIPAHYSSKQIDKESIDYDIVVKRGPRWQELHPLTVIGLPSSEVEYYEPCQFSWVSVSGQVNKNLLFNLMEGLMFYVLNHPGLPLDLLDKRFFRGGLSRSEINILVSFLTDKSVLHLSQNKALTLTSSWLLVRFT